MMINFPNYQFGQTKEPTKKDDSNSIVLLGLGALLGYLIFDSIKGQSLEGGKGDKLSPSEVDPSELKKGLKVEMEHTKEPSIAQEIALDHLAEDTHYYSHLERIHKENPIKDPKGGLTAQGRKHFKETEGANLQAGVMKVETLEDLKRWGMWARRFYGRSVLPPMKDENGEPTRIALDAQAWGCKIPKTKKEAKVIARRGREALKYYKELKKKGYKTNDSVRFAICG